MFFITLTGVIMAYPWANDLLYRLTGNPPPPRQNENAGHDARTGTGQHRGHRENVTVTVPDTNTILEVANQEIPGWRTITLRLNADAKATVLQVDHGDGGRPDLRTQITIDSAGSHPPRVESFSSYNRGRHLRMWARFTHTGEAGGIAGETVALIAALGAAALIVTGFSLSLRRLRSTLSSKTASHSLRVKESETLQVGKNPLQQRPPCAQ